MKVIIIGFIGIGLAAVIHIYDMECLKYTTETAYEIEDVHRNSYWTSNYKIKNGCVEFEQKTICGSFTISSYSKKLCIQENNVH